jgi:hypothetical protein
VNNPTPPRPTAAAAAGLPVDLPRNGSRALNRAAVVVVAIALAIGVVGAVLALGMVRLGQETSALQQDASLATRGTAGIAQDVPTSFGVVAVESVTRSAGPTAKALAGVTHGIQNLVPPNKVGIDATVVMTNLRETPVKYTPRQFQLYATRGGEPGPGDRPIPLSRASIQPGTLQPDASVEATLRYVAPRNGAKLWMTFTDPARESRIVVDLGRTGRTPPGALAQYHAHGR